MNINIREIIISKSSNIGALCRFIVSNNGYIEFIHSSIPDLAIEFKLSEKLWYFTNNIKEIQLCICGENKSFIGFKNGYRISCGNKLCYVKIRKETSMVKYGTDNPIKCDIIKNKRDNTLMLKYGGHQMNNDDVREKFKKTMIDRYGVEWAQQNTEISIKSRETFNLNINKENIYSDRTKSIINKSAFDKEKISEKKKNTIIVNFGNTKDYYIHIQNKIRETSLEKYGVEHFFKSDCVISKRINSYKSRIVNKYKELLPNDIVYVDKENKLNDSVLILNCLKCNSNFNINRQFFVYRIKNKSELCLNCNPVLSGKSKMELDVLDYIRELYSGEIITNSKNLIKKEIDIYLPNLNLAFEFNGLYWHSDEYKHSLYHLEKTKLCSDENVQLIHIWEDDWIYKNRIIKSRILNLIGKSDKIFARKCDVREVCNFEYREFINNNHLQGFVGARLKLGLYYNNELISCMSFGSLRSALGQKHKEGEWELLRFCNILNTTVVGGASRLFKHFTEKLNPNVVISYSDKCWSVGNLYTRLGLLYLSTSSPNYFYIVDGIRRHRFNYRKDILIKRGYDASKTEYKIMTELGYNRIYDCGNDKWIWKNDQNYLSLYNGNNS